MHQNTQQATACTGCSCDQVCPSELLAQIKEIAQSYRNKEGALIPVLHMAQAIYGYLPLEVQTAVADGLGIPLAQVSGVVSFYSFFATQRRGKHTIRVCLGTACYVRGGKKLVEELTNLLHVKVGDTTEDGQFTFEVARCIGACGLAPAMSIDDTVYKRVNPENLAQILSQYGDTSEEKEDETQ